MTPANTSTESSLIRPQTAGAIKALRVVLGVMAIVVVAGIFTGGTESIRVVALVTGAAVTVARAILVKEERLLWAIWGVGLVAWTGQLYYIVAPNAATTFPAVPDYMALVFYVCAMATGVLLVKSRLHGRRKSLWLDGLIGGLALSALMSVFVFRAALAGSGVPSGIVQGQLGYAMSDLFILGFIGVIAVLGGRRVGFASRAFMGGFALFALADSLYVIAVAGNQLAPSALVTLLWALGTLTLAAAAMQRRRVFQTSDATTLVAVLLLGISALSSLCLLLAYATGLAQQTATLLALTAAVLGVTVVRFCASLVENARLLKASRREAMTDALTGLGNRRQLTHDLAVHLTDLDPRRPLMLTLFDLDGFKEYNDMFGHPAGDGLLRRLGARLRDLLAEHGTAYRMGGDEFCTLWNQSDADKASVTTPKAMAALSERGEAFSIGCSYGSVQLPGEATNLSDSLRIADRRMYGRKGKGRVSAGQQSSDVLQRALLESDSELSAHLGDVDDLVSATAQALGLPQEELEAARQTALLHDVGKVAIPDGILNKPGPLDESEWAFMKRHTLIGERIISAAPALTRVAKIVRSTHERYDGDGYPDGLAGDDIPLIARLVAVCDAYNAMSTKRVYRDRRDRAEAIAELRRCSGTQFDPEVVETFVIATQRAELLEASQQAALAGSAHNQA